MRRITEEEYWMGRSRADRQKSTIFGLVIFFIVLAIAIIHIRIILGRG